MKKTIIAILIVISCLLFAVAGCGEEKAKIGVVVPDLNNAFCTAMDAGVTRAAQENGYEVFEFVTQMNPENDIASVEQLANNNVKAYYGLHMVTESVGDLLKNTYTDIGCFSQVKFDGAIQVLDDEGDGKPELFVISAEEGLIHVNPEGDVLAMTLEDHFPLLSLSFLLC